MSERVIVYNPKIEVAHQAAAGKARQNPEQAVQELWDLWQTAADTYEPHSPTAIAHEARLNRDEAQCHARLAVRLTTADRNKASLRFDAGVTLLESSAEQLDKLDALTQLTDADRRHIKGERLATFTMHARVLGARAITMPNHVLADRAGADSFFGLAADLADEGGIDNAYYLASEHGNRERWRAYQERRTGKGAMRLLIDLGKNPDFRSGSHKRAAVRTIIRLGRDSRRGPEAITAAVQAGNI